MNFFLRWGCLLIIGLAAPIALPAGGGFRDKLEIENIKEPLICMAGQSCYLLSSPYFLASKLYKVDLGSHLKVIRIWQDQQGEKWIQVKETYNNHLFKNPRKSKRGWIHV